VAFTLCCGIINNMKKIHKSTLVLIILSGFLLMFLFAGFLLWGELNPNTYKDKVLGIKKNKMGSYRIEADKSVSAGSHYKVKVIVNTQNQAVNAVSLYLHFDPNKLELINLDTTQSFCQFYPENRFDNHLGKVSISCGSPNPGFTGESTLAVIDFYTKTLGKTRLSIDSQSQILLNDGKGTNIYPGGLIYDLNIINNI